MKSQLKHLLITVLVLITHTNLQAQTYADPYSQGVGGYANDQPVGTAVDVLFQVGNGTSADGTIGPNTVEWTLNFPVNILTVGTATQMPPGFYEYGRTITATDIIIFIRTNAVIPFPTIMQGQDFEIHYPVTGTVPNIQGTMTLNDRMLPGSGWQGNNDVNNDNASSPIRFSASTLPVFFTSFTANANNCIAQLNWETAKELNLKQFEVQRMDNNEYTTVATILAKGDNSKYTYTGDFKGENVLYRLKIVDNDGKITFNNDIKPLTCKSSVYAINLYPNPTQNNLTIAINKDDNTLLPDIAFYNAVGQKVNAKLMNNLNNKTFTYSLESLAAGMYSVSINDNTYGKSTLKVVKK